MRMNQAKGQSKVPTNRNDESKYRCSIRAREVILNNQGTKGLVILVVLIKRRVGKAKDEPKHN